MCRVASLLLGDEPSRSLELSRKSCEKPPVFLIAADGPLARVPTTGYTEQCIAFRRPVLVRSGAKARSSELAVASWGLGDMPECILIVDDDPNIRKHTRNFLERETQYSVCGEAVDGLDAIEKARQLQPDLIILDMSMPRMNGLQAARVLRQMMRDVPIILFTLHASAITFSEVQAVGVSSVVSKSDGFNGLRKKVESLLESV